MADGRRVDIQTFLNENPFSVYQWTIFGLCFWIVLLDGFDTAAIGYVAPSLIAEWGVERPGVAWTLGGGRFGGIGGSFLVAELSRLKLGFSEVFVVVAVSGLISAVAPIAKQLVCPEGRSASAAGREEPAGH